MSLPVINQHIYSILQPNHAKSIHIDLFLQDISFLSPSHMNQPLASPRHCWAGNAQSGGGPGPEKKLTLGLW